MPAKIEEIIFTLYCGIDLGDLADDELLDPNKVKVSPEIYDKIIADIKEEYPELSGLKINLVLLQYGAHVDENLENDEIELLNGFIRKKKMRDNDEENQSVHSI